jgi:N-acetylmuramic acid 6-phosphate etherase
MKGIYNMSHVFTFCFAISFAACNMYAGAFQCSDAVKAKARDFFDNEKQFHLGFLPTEQSNPITATLEEDFKRSTLAGVQCLQRGDRQIPITMRHVFAGEKFEKLVSSMVETLKAPKGRIIFSGCGATGRLSILLESMWRDFFHRRAAELTPEERKLADRSASIMTGGDFALIRSVEFFEDFAEGGRRQAAALKVGEGDTFVAITEGGETSSVLGTLKYAAENGAKCFLVFNNPADLLRGYLDRCREAIENPKVTVLDIYCGSMSVAGSTRMQATSSEQLLGSCALEAALVRVMPRFAKETAKDYTVAFEKLLAGLESPSGRAGLVKAIEFEKGVYDKHGRITYLADKCMLDLFTDNTERSPTFMLPPLRSSRDKHLAQSWAFVKNPLFKTVDCWSEMMRRHPRCLNFTSEDARSLKMPQRFIDNPPLIKYSDLITYMIGNEPAPERIKGYDRAAAVMLTVGDKPANYMAAAKKLAADWPECIEFHIGPQQTDDIWINMEIADSPLEIWKHLAVKLAFNCLSTGTMAASGRVAGNWMSWVSISNKKLIDRGIRLLIELGGIDYEEAAQRIFAAKEWVASQDWTGKEEPCAVQVALEALKKSK